ncbi:MAG: hypothetical protein LUC18_04280, partial [Porphyromonadaceae bacterium]|nr:hypothetical protein [Porphyromonadaceae bacterium]
MKLFRLILCGATALLALSACNSEEPQEDQESEHDDEYYAANASINSGNTRFTSTDEGGTIEFKAEGGEVVINVDCGTDWTVENTASDLFETTIGSNSLTVTAEQNTVEEDLTGSITFYTAAQHVKFATVTVTQSAYGAPEIKAGTDEWHVPAVGDLTTEITVEASAEWTVENTAEWLTVETTDSGLSLTAVENGETEERSTKLTLPCTDGIRTSYEYISVTQDPKAYISLSDEELSVKGSGETVSVTVESNFDWDFSYDTANGWYTVERDGDALNLTVDVNPADEERDGSIIVTSGDGAENTAQAQITFTQGENVIPLILTFTTTAAGTDIILPLEGTVDCIVDWGDGSDPETVTSTLPTHTY